VNYGENAVNYGENAVNYGENAVNYGGFAVECPKIYFLAHFLACFLGLTAKI